MTVLRIGDMGSWLSFTADSYVFGQKVHHTYTHLTTLEGRAIFCNYVRNWENKDELDMFHDLRKPKA